MVQEVTFDALIHESPVARIYRATYLGAPVALKQYKADVDHKERRRQRMEFNLLRSLRSLNVLPFIGVLERPTFSVVTEYMPKGSLRDFLASGER